MLKIDESKIEPLTVLQTNLKDHSTDCSNSDSSSRSSQKERTSKRKNYVLKNDFISGNSKVYRDEMSSNEKQSKILQKKSSKEELLLSYYGSIFEGNKLNFSESISQNKPKENKDLLIKKMQTSSGSTEVQKIIKSNANYANLCIYPLLKNEMIHLANDKHVTYVFQELIEVLSEENLDEFLCLVCMHFSKFAFLEHSTKIIQKLIESMDLKTKRGEKIYQLLSTKIKGNVAKISVSSNSTYIIQKMISYCPFPYNNFIFEEICGSFLKIALKKFGCYVIQKALISSNQMQRIALVNLIYQNAFVLISSQYGNYICQCLIKLGNDCIISNFYKIISSDISTLSKEKYSSIVIEKFFEIENSQLMNEIAKDILKKESKVVELLCNEYGNFIIQKILTTIQDRVLVNRILHIVINNVNKILKQPFGKFLLVNLSNIFPLFFQYVDKV